MKTNRLRSFHSIHSVSTAKERDEQCAGADIRYFGRWFHGYSFGYQTTTGKRNFNGIRWFWNWKCNVLILFRWQPVTESTTADPAEPTTTTTERYRISRKELGYILGRNYRGLQKLFHIELNDALNVRIPSIESSKSKWIIFHLFSRCLQQSKYSIQEYKQEAGNAVAQYTIPKEFPPPKASKSWFHSTDAHRQWQPNTTSPWLCST